MESNVPYMFEKKPAANDFFLSRLDFFCEFSFFQRLILF